jgi:predicted nucleotidyltransferase
VGDLGSRLPEALSATRFPELNDLLTDFVSRVRWILEPNLVGVYLTGSFALGGADAASDCDFLVVTAAAISRDDECRLRKLHEEIPTWPGYWAYNLEGSYAPREDLQTLAALERRWLYINRGKREMEWSTHCNTEDVRWVLAERPLVLWGVDPSAFACRVPAAVLRTKMLPQIENFLDDLATWASFTISWTQRYAVEASSRMLYTLEHGEVISKQSALRWAAETLPAEWRDLIDQVRKDRFVQWNNPPRPASVDRSLAFVNYVQERARRSQAQADVASSGGEG